MTEEEKRLSQNVPDALLYQPGRYDADVVVNRWYDHLTNQCVNGGAKVGHWAAQK